MEYHSDGGSGASFSDAGTVSSDVVLTQTQMIYDGDGNVIETITSDRFNTDSQTATGALGIPQRRQWSAGLLRSRLLRSRRSSNG